MRKEIQDWFDQALAEGRTACHCFSSGDFYAAAFHSQQAMELGLKALYMFQKSEFPPRTHYLLDLTQRLDLPKKFLESARELTPVYTLSRYPDIAGGAPYKIYSQQKVADLIRMMEEFLQWLQKYLRK